MQAGLAPCRRTIVANAAARTIGTAGQSPGFEATPDQPELSLGAAHSPKPFTLRLGTLGESTLSPAAKTDEWRRRADRSVEILCSAAFLEPTATARKTGLPR